MLPHAPVLTLYLQEHSHLPSGTRGLMLYCYVHMLMLTGCFFPPLALPSFGPLRCFYMLAGCLHFQFARPAPLGASTCCS